MRNLEKLELVESKGIGFIPLVKAKKKEFDKLYVKLLAKEIEENAPAIVNSYTAYPKHIITEQELDILGESGITQKYGVEFGKIELKNLMGFQTKQAENHPVNHYRRMKGYFKIDGRRGLVQYVKNLSSRFVVTKKQLEAMSKEDIEKYGLVAEYFNVLVYCISIGGLPFRTIKTKENEKVT